MNTFLTTLHIMTAISLILVVLLQRGKGADLGAALGGGGANTVFGARGAGNFLTKLTTGAAVVFMLTSLSLSYLATQDSSVQIFDDEPLLEDSMGLLEEAGEVSVSDPLQDGAAAGGDATRSGALEEIPSEP
jgi:preprotein translocase subunit SecG